MVSNSRSATASILRDLCGQQKILTIPRTLLEFFNGDHACALLFSQIVYWAERGDCGWFYKTYEDWNKELCMSEYQVRRCAKFLSSEGLITVVLEKHNGAPTLHYGVNDRALEEWILKKLKNRFLKNSRMDSSETQETYKEDIEYLSENTLQENHLSTNEPPVVTEESSEEELYLEDSIERFVTDAYKREGRGRIKLGRKTDTRIVERLTDLESRSGPQEFRAALLRFLGTETEWLKENKWPLNAFLKEWEVWAVDKPARAARPAAPDRRSPALPHTTPPSSSNPSERVVAPAAGRDFAAEWDAAIPARPSLYDAGLDGDGSYKKCAADPEFCKQYAKVLEQARLAIGDDGSGASWITFDWILKRDKESGQWNWRKVLKGSYAPRKASAAQAAEDDPFTRIRMKMKKAKEEREKANEQV